MEKARFQGKTWHAQVQEIIAKLPQNVHVSFDIDGLTPELCPNTGTPVAGGLSLHESFYLLSEVRRSGRKIVSFDLCEVGPSEWDGNVGARVLYKLAVLAGEAIRQKENA
jgi:agmatinase